jgi:hypothetical protein
MANDITTRILVETKEAVKSVSQFTSQASSSLNGLEKTVGGLSTAFKLVAGSFIATKIVSGIKDIVAEASDAQAATEGLANALKQSGDFSDQNVQAFKNLATQIQRTSKFSDDLVISQFTVAKQFNATNKEAATLVRAAVELSARTGKDLPETTQLLGRALDGTAGKLNEMVSGVRNLTAEQLKNNGAAELILKTYGGSAAAQLSTFSGIVEQTKNNFSDLFEALGNAIVQNPATVQSFKILNDLFINLVDVIDKNSASLGSLVRDGFVVAIKGASGLIYIFNLVRETFALLGANAAYVIEVLTKIPTLAKNAASFNFDANKKILGDLKETLNSSVADIQNNGKVYRDLEKSLDAVSGKLQGVQYSQDQVTAATDKSSVAFDKQGSTIKRISSDILDKAKDIIEQFKSIGLTQSQNLTLAANKQLAILDQVKRAHALNDRDIADTKRKIEKKLSEDLRKLDDERLKKRIADASQNPFTFFQSRNAITDDITGNSQGLSARQQEGLGAGLSAFASILQGKQGAISLAGQIASSVGTSLFGPAGQALGPIVQILAQGKDQVRAMVTEFLDALPVIIQNISEAIPEIVNTLADKLSDDEFVEKLGRALVRATFKLSQELPNIMALAAIKMIGKLLEGAGQFVGKILSGAVQFVGKIIEGAGRFVGELIKKLTGIGGGGGSGGKGIVGSVLGPIGGIIGGGGGNIIDTILSPFKRIRFAEGGAIPPGFNNDQFPLRAQSGEYVLDRSLSAKLENALSGNGSSQMVQVNIMLGEQNLASAIVNLQRKGFRLTA